MLLNSLSVPVSIIAVFPYILCSFHVFTKLHLGNLLALSHNLKNNLVSILCNLFETLENSLVKMCVFLFFFWINFLVLHVLLFFVKPHPPHIHRRATYSPFPQLGLVERDPLFVWKLWEDTEGREEHGDTAEAANSLPLACVVSSTFSPKRSLLCPLTVFSVSKIRFLEFPAKPSEMELHCHGLLVISFPFLGTSCPTGFLGRRLHCAVEIVCPWGWARSGRGLVKEGTSNEYWMLYGSDESLSSTPETSITLYVN